jgi:hypothetical protein
VVLAEDMLKVLHVVVRNGEALKRTDHADVPKPLPLLRFTHYQGGIAMAIALTAQMKMVCAL